MPDRSALGAADVPDAVLAAMVADLLGVEEATLLSASAEEVDYDLPAITTGGRWWVRGTVAVEGHERAFTLFVKHVHEWSRSPFFADLPEEVRPWAAKQVPWRTEGAVYASDLRDRLPAGLAMPRSLGVHPIDDLAYAVWLEPVPVADVAWDLDRYQRAAHLLGRMAASPAVRELAGIGGHEWSLTQYVEGRLRFQVLPALADDGLWRHPVVAETFGDLRPRLAAAAESVDAVAAELTGLPSLVGHGDACPNNLLVRPDRDGFTLIDFGFLTALPVGFDLGQLLVGDVQIGRHSPEDLGERDEMCVASCHRGLVAEGVDVGVDVLWRAHALQLLLFTGLSALPFDLLDSLPQDALRATATSRAAIARHVLDLVDQTG